MDATIENPCPLLDGNDGPTSSGSLSVLTGDPLTLWSTSTPGQDTQTDVEFCLGPGGFLIIGRWEGREVEYLDPAYRPTTIVPATGQTILQSGGEGKDTYVSRGHFMLRSALDGVLFINGVPRRGGGIRPPVNGTWILSPVKRLLAPGEAYLIEPTAAAVFRLPNDSEVQICAR